MSYEKGLIDFYFLAAQGQTGTFMTALTQLLSYSRGSLPSGPPPPPSQPVRGQQPSAALAVSESLLIHKIIGTKR